MTIWKIISVYCIMESGNDPSMNVHMSKQIILASHEGQLTCYQFTTVESHRDEIRAGLTYSGRTVMLVIHQAEFGQFSYRHYGVD